MTGNQQIVIHLSRWFVARAVWSGAWAAARETGCAWDPRAWVMIVWYTVNILVRW